MRLLLAIGTAVIVGYVQLINHAQVIQHFGKLSGSIIKHDLLEILTGLRNVFRVMTAGSHIE